MRIGASYLCRAKFPIRRRSQLISISGRKAAVLHPPFLFSGTCNNKYSFTNDKNWPTITIRVKTAHKGHL